MVIDDDHNDDHDDDHDNDNHVQERGPRDHDMSRAGCSPRGETVSAQNEGELSQYDYCHGCS